MCTGIRRELICRTHNCGMRDDGTQAPYRTILIPTAMCRGRDEHTYLYCKWYIAESDHIGVYRIYRGWCDGCWEAYYDEMNNEHLP